MASALVDCASWEQIEVLTISCVTTGIQSPVAVAGCLGGRAQNDDTEENIPVSPDTGQTKLTEQETIFFTGVLDELKIVMSNSRDVSCLARISKCLTVTHIRALEFSCS